VRIDKFAYEDLETGWKLEETGFDGLNLLVGVSGVGKTRIIEALRTVVLVAGGFDDVPRARWMIDFDSDGTGYRWTAETADGANGHRGQRVFVRERVTRSGNALVERSEGGFTFNDRPLPKLNPTESAIVLLGGEDAFEPIEHALDHVIFSLFSGAHHDPARHFEFTGEGDELLDEMLRWSQEGAALGGRFESDAGSDPHREAAQQNVFVLHLFLMQEAYSEQFASIRERFCDVFPSVDDVRVVREATRDRLTVEIHETSGPWVPQSRISSGMLKTLVYLCELDTAPSGSVIVIDEFEASLGLNCLPAMTDALLDRSDCQFIVTSHHPYVINNIPIEHWKLVERKGSAVRLVSAREIPALASASHHEAFLRLINLDRYAHGIR
jgi:hypothetical protein